MTNHHNLLNNSLSRRGQLHPQSHAIQIESTHLDDDSLMDEVKTNSNYDADSYISGNANEYNALSEHLSTSCPRQVANQKQP